MSPSRARWLFQTTSVQHFISALVEDLVSRRSLLVLLPSGVDSQELWSRLNAELWHREFGYRVVQFTEGSHPRSPMARLAQSLDTEWSSTEAPPTLTSLAEAENLTEIVELEGLERLAGTERQEWMRFLTDWARASQNAADRGHKPIAICLIVPATAVPEVPESSVYLAVHWWWGFPSALEVQLLCRWEGESKAWDSAARWREYLLPSLAGNDVSLVEYLWDDVGLALDRLRSRLITFAVERAWSAELLRDWGATTLNLQSRQLGPKPLLMPPISLRNLWANGALSWTTEYGIELHSAAHAQIDSTEALRHRLWRGQAELLLPLVDQMRLMLCTHLTQQYGQDWALRWSKPASPEEEAAIHENPLACQLGYLEQLLMHCDHLRGERYWLPLVSLGRWLRNELAHYRQINFHDFDMFFSGIQRNGR